MYALGVIFYQLLVADPSADRPSGKWKKRMTEQGASPQLLDLLEGCLDNDSAERPMDGADLAARLATPPPPPVPVVPGEATRRFLDEQWRDLGKGGGPLRANRGRGLAILAAVVLVGIGGWVLLAWLNRPPPPPPPHDIEPPPRAEENRGLPPGQYKIGDVGIYTLPDDDLLTVGLATDPEVRLFSILAVVRKHGLPDSDQCVKSIVAGAKEVTSAPGRLSDARVNDIRVELLARRGWALNGNRVVVHPNVAPVRVKEVQDSIDDYRRWLRIPGYIEILDLPP